MKRFKPALWLCAVIFAAIQPLPARAEGNRLLPFWGQPYPFGFARTAEVSPRDLAPCRERRFHVAARERLRGGGCEVVLHARD